SIDMLAFICGAALFFINQSVKGPVESHAGDLAYPLSLVSPGSAGITALGLIVTNAALALTDVWGYVRTRKDAARAGADLRDRLRATCPAVADELLGPHATPRPHENG